MTSLLPLVGAALDGEALAPYDPERDPYRAYLDRLDSETSRRSVRGRLDRLAQIITMDETGTVTGAGLPWEKLRYEHTVRIRALLRDKRKSDGTPAYAPSTVNTHLSALRQVLQECWRLGLMTAEEYQRAADLESVKGTRVVLAGRHMPGGVMQATLAACDENEDVFRGLRDAAILSTLYTTGARRAEVARLELDDYDPVERAFRLLGKGNKERVVYVTLDAAKRINAWIEARGRTPGGMFPPISRGGNCWVREGRFTTPSDQTIADVLERCLLQACAERYTPHDARRALIGELLDAGVDLATAQEIAGHASPVTTAKYDRRPGRRLRDAIDRLPQFSGAPAEEEHADG